MKSRDTDRREIGASGEDFAWNYLLQRGLRPILRNYRCTGGELDLVMLDGSTLALIEVRLRTDERFGGAAASVTPTKQKRLVIAAKHLLTTRKDLTRYRARFDVVALSENALGEMKVEWIRDAFRL